MADEKLIRLLGDLKQATSQGRLHWTEAEGENSFRITLGSAVVEIEEEVHGDDHVYITYNVVVRDEQGKTLQLEFFDNKRLNADHYGLVRELYDLARRDALKIDQVLDSMISLIQKIQ